ncbi:transposase, partial [Candidatus Woesearchaeota archaeon]|nr:transposase [Candidatus Woesearchaeota archaeon]
TRKSFLLSAKNLKQRMTFIQTLKDKEIKCENIFYTDEKIFTLTPGNFTGNCWVRLSFDNEKLLKQGDVEVYEKYLVKNFKKFPAGFMVAGGVSAYGPGTLIFFSGTVDSTAYSRVLEIYQKDIRTIKNFVNKVETPIENENKINENNIIITDKSLNKEEDKYDEDFVKNFNFDKNKVDELFKKEEEKIDLKLKKYEEKLNSNTQQKQKKTKKTKGMKTNKQINDITMISDQAYENFMKYDQDQEKKANAEQFLFFQQDNSSVHKAKIIRSKLEKIFPTKTNNLIQVQWPSNSPDISPIEIIWSLLSQQLYTEKFESLEKMRTKIVFLWNRIPEELIACLFKRNEEIMEDVLEAKGHKSNPYARKNNQKLQNKASIIKRFENYKWTEKYSYLNDSDYPVIFSNKTLEKIKERYLLKFSKQEKFYGQIQTLLKKKMNEKVSAGNYHGGAMLNRREKCESHIYFIDKLILITKNEKIKAEKVIKEEQVLDFIDKNLIMSLSEQYPNLREITKALMTDKKSIIFELLKRIITYWDLTKYKSASVAMRKKISHVLEFDNEDYILTILNKDDNKYDEETNIDEIDNIEEQNKIHYGNLFIKIDEEEENIIVDDDNKSENLVDSDNMDLDIC